MTTQPSDIVYAEALEYAGKAREFAMSAAYGNVVLGLLLDEDPSKYGIFEIKIRAFRIRRKIKRELRSATRLNNQAAKLIRRAHEMKAKEVDNDRWGSDA